MQETKICRLKYVSVEIRLIMYWLIINNANAMMNNGQTGSSIQLEGFPGNMRLSIAKRLARNLGNPKSVPLDNPHVAPEFMPASSGNVQNNLRFIFFMSLRVRCN